MRGVLVVGGGPVGLSLAIRLAQLAVPVTLVERHPATATFPKGRALSIRSMEIYRGWGLEPDVTAAGLPRDNLAFYTGATLTADRHNRIVTGPAVRPPIPSPTYTLLCSQDRLEPLLRAHAERLAPGRIRFGTELVDFSDGPEGVICELRHGDQTERLRADWLVAADGANSGVRQRLGISMPGARDVSHNLNILFDADLRRHVADRLSAVYTISTPGLHGFFLAVDNDRRWLFNLVVDGDDPRLAGYDDATCVHLIRTAAGLPDLPITLHDRQVWRASARVAERFHAGRVFLAGDAAHVTTPYGGFGVNCGIADADNLGWKLAAVHHGWAGPRLLDTYEPERRPVAQVSAEESHRRLREAITAHRTGAPQRPRPSEGLVLGYAYDSTAVIPDGSPAPEHDPVAEYQPTARPGHRAPHLWLEHNGQQVSTLDLLGPGLTLLTTPAGVEWAEKATAVAAARGIPLPLRIVGATGLADPGSGFTDAYGLSPEGVVLVRPDGHVAWRGVSMPHPAPDAVLDRLLHR